MGNKSWETRMRKAHRGLRARSGVEYSKYVKLSASKQHAVTKYAASLGFSSYKGKSDVVHKINSRIQRELKEK